MPYNGSIFTMDMSAGTHGFVPKGTRPNAVNADYRDWGRNLFMWQNTRHPYWSMLARGDYDIMMPVFRLVRGVGLGRSGAVFLAACLGDLATYLCTSVQLAWAFPDPVGGMAASLLKFGGIFALTQIPLAVSEGLLTVLVVNAMARFNAAELQSLPLFARRGVQA